MKPIHIIGAATGWGGRRRGPEQGPATLQRLGLLGRLQKEDLDADWIGTVNTSRSRQEYPHVSREESFEYVLEFCRRMVPYVTKAVQEDALPLVIGGDHSVAMSTWSAVTSALETKENFGLIWIDAHMDAHTPETAAEGRWGGMYHARPLAVLQGYGEEELINMATPGPKLTASHICLIGARSYEPGEATFLEKHGVRVIDGDEISRIGFQAAWEEALGIASSAPGGFGLSIDLDVFCPKDAPGVSTNEHHGIKASTILETLKGIGRDECLQALEIVEFNPDRDENNKTARLVEQLILSIFQEGTE